MPWLPLKRLGNDYKNEQDNFNAIELPPWSFPKSFASSRVTGNLSSPVSGKSSTATDAVSDIPASIKNGTAPLNVALKGRYRFYLCACYAYMADGYLLCTERMGPKMMLPFLMCLTMLLLDLWQPLGTFRIPSHIRNLMPGRSETFRERQKIESMVLFVSLEEMVQIRKRSLAVSELSNKSNKPCTRFPIFLSIFANMSTRQMEVPPSAWWPYSQRWVRTRDRRRGWTPPGLSKWQKCRWVAQSSPIVATSNGTWRCSSHSSIPGSHLEVGRHVMAINWRSCRAYFSTLQ